MHGTGTGAGENPISTAPFMASVCNVCPECNYGDLDFADSADGRWDIKWHYVPCPCEFFTGFNSVTSSSEQGVHLTETDDVYESAGMP